jgi:hypothetical protein
VGAAVDRLLVKLGLVVVPPYPRRVDGKLQMVDGYSYWREGSAVKRIADAMSDEASTATLDRDPLFEVSEPLFGPVPRFGASSTQELADYWTEVARQVRPMRFETAPNDPPTMYWRDQHDLHIDTALLADKLERHFGKRSGWTGILERVDPWKRRIKGEFSWGGIMRLAEESIDRPNPEEDIGQRALAANRFKVMMHEMAHSVSEDAHTDPDAYFNAPGFEEGVVEGWTRTHLPEFVQGVEWVHPQDREQTGHLSIWGITHTYDRYVEPLNRLAEIFVDVPREMSEDDERRRYATFFDFLIRVPLRLRPNVLLTMAERMTAAEKIQVRRLVYEVMSSDREQEVPI